MGMVAPTHESWFSSSQTRASSSSPDALVGASCFADLADVGLGLRFRSATPGPETDLVEAFLANLDVALPRGRRLTVFCQPALETGFPDIVAIEAKISWWRRALEQAGGNVWFSSESHALMPSVSDREAVADVAQRFQVGVLQFEDARPTEIWAAPQRPVPASYGSWLFNEWVWRIARRLGDI